jgi:hypothetical protein
MNDLEPSPLPPEGTTIEDELRVLARLVDEFEALEQKVQERVATYLFDRYGTRSPW